MTNPTETTQTTNRLTAIALPLPRSAGGRISPRPIGRESTGNPVNGLSVGIQQNVLIAGLTIASIPAIVFFLIFQRSIMVGLTSGALKS